MADDGPDEGRRATVPALSKIRLRVLAETGFPPAVLKRLEPRHVDYRAGTVLCRTGASRARRRSPPRTVPVTGRRPGGAARVLRPGRQRAGLEPVVAVEVLPAGGREGQAGLRARTSGSTWPAPENVAAVRLAALLRRPTSTTPAGTNPPSRYVLMHSTTSHRHGALHPRQGVGGNAVKGPGCAGNRHGNRGNSRHCLLGTRAKA